MADTVVTLRPNTTDYNTFTIAGGSADADDALRDGTDAGGSGGDGTYLSGSGSVSFQVSQFLNGGSLFVIPANAVVRGITYRARFAGSSAMGSLTLGGFAGGSPITLAQSVITGGSSQPPANPASWAGGLITKTGGWTQADLNSLAVYGFFTDQSANTRLYALYVDVAYNQVPTKPVVTASTPYSTPRPTFTAPYSDPEGDNMLQWDYRVYTTIVDPATTSVAATASGSGLTDLAGAVSGSTPTFKIPTDIANGTYYIYIRVADTGTGGYSPWSTAVAFTVSVDLPAAPSLSNPTYTAATNVVTLTATEQGNLLSGIMADFEEPAWAGGQTTAGYNSVPGYALGTNAATFGNGGGGNHGTKGGQIITTAAGDAYVETVFIPVTTGLTYSAFCSFEGFTTPRNGRIDIVWYDSSQAQLSITTGTPLVLSSAVWGTTALTTAAAPANAVYAKLRLNYLGGTAGGETCYVDQVSFAQGSSATWTRGGFVAGPNLMTENQSNFEVFDSTTWTVTGSTNNSCTVAGSTTQKKVGTQSMKVANTHTVAQDVTVTTLPNSTTSPVGGFAVVAGAVYSAGAWVWCNNVNPPGPITLTIAWFKSDGTSAGASAVYASPPAFATASTWRPYYVIGVAPALAAYGVFSIKLATMASNSGDSFFIDAAWFRRGLTDTYIPPSITPYAYTVERSIDGGTTWSTVRSIASLATEPSSITVSDYENANGASVRYRARAVGYDYLTTTTGALTGSVGATTSAVVVAAPDYWLKDVDTPADNIKLNVRKRATSIRETAATFYPLGAARPVVVADTMTGDDGHIAVQTYSAADHAALMVQMRKQKTLLLQDPDGAQYFVRFSKRDIERVNAGTGNQLREDSFDYVEVAAL